MPNVYFSLFYLNLSDNQKLIAWNDKNSPFWLAFERFFLLQLAYSLNVNRL